MEFIVKVADGSHGVFAEEICQEIYLSSLERKTGIAKRTPEYIIEKMEAGKAVIALTGTAGSPVFLISSPGAERSS